MKKLSALALAGLLAAPAAYAADVQFGGDTDFEYYNTRNVAGSGDDAESVRSEGFRQRIRLQSVVDAGNGVQLHTRLNLFNDRWYGDASGTQPDENPFTTRGNRTVQLDYGFVQMPMGPGTFRVGRQISNWNNNFTASDDRRDRISYATRIAGQTLSLSYDRRQARDETDRSLDGNQFNVALLGGIGDTGWNYGVLLTTWDAGSSGAGQETPTGDPLGYGLRGAKLFAPYVTGAAGPVDMMIGAHYLGDSRGHIFTEDTFGGYIRAGMQATDDIRMEGQVVYTDGGTLVAGGFDSFSSLIHNSLDHSVSATRIDGLNLGGAGQEANEDDSTLLVAIRAQLAVAPDLTLTPAIGWVNYERGPGATGDVDIDEDVVFVDLRADFALNPATNLYAAVGYADAEDYLGKNVSGFTTGLNVRF